MIAERLLAQLRPAGAWLPVLVTLALLMPGFAQLQDPTESSRAVQELQALALDAELLDTPAEPTRNIEQPLKVPVAGSLPPSVDLADLLWPAGYKLDVVRTIFHAAPSPTPAFLPRPPPCS